MTMTAGRSAPRFAVYGGPVTAGIGCTSGACADDIIALVLSTLAASGLEVSQLAALGSHSRKQGFVPLHQAAQHFDVSLHFLDELAGDLPNPSAFVARTVGLPGIAEAVALAAGPLLAGKHKSTNVTCALGAGILPGSAQASSFNAAIASSRLATSSAGP